ncbi:MAG: hypothetical protein WC342_08090 [Methanoregula sp.]|jgi:multicomponent Na+:H+ antiporter subunit G
MIELLADVLLSVILLAAILFGWISVVGLLLFPDIRSRAFTGVRAGLVATGLVTASGVIYGIYKWAGTGEMQYPVYAGAAVLLCVLLVILNLAGSRALCKNPAPTPGSAPGKAAGTRNMAGKKD